MNLTSKTSSRRSGFTLVEMIGVLAVIAILSGLLIPRVFSAITSSKINTTAMGYNSLKSASAQYIGKNSAFPGTNATFHTALITGGFIEGPLSAPIADATDVFVKTATVGSLGTPVFDLTGTGSALPAGAVVVYAQLDNVALSDAVALNEVIDGKSAAFGPDTLGGADAKGRVSYGAPVGGKVSVLLYVANQ